MSFFQLSDVAITVIALALTGSFGLLLGHLKIKGVGLGIGGVLFSGLLIGYFTNKTGVEFDEHVLHFLREFGLILFVYTIGIQVGPAFFASFRSAGIRFNIIAVSIVLGGTIVTLLIYYIADIPLPVLVGLMSGAVTNTPGLGAATQALADVGYPATSGTEAGTAYAIAYPFGILGILLAMLLIRFFFRIKIKTEVENYNKETNSGEMQLPTIDVIVTNPNLDGIKLGNVPDLFDQGVVASRILMKDGIAVPTHNTIVHKGDVLHIVGPADKLESITLILGEKTDKPVSTKGSRLTWTRMVVTNSKILGKQLKSLALEEKYEVTISRINRAGIELSPLGSSALVFGDVITVVGRPEDIDAVKLLLGDERARLNEVQFSAVFIGLVFGVLLGSIPIAIPGLSAPLKLGLAGGPLIVAILLGRVGHYGPFNWFMPPVANIAIRELGIVLFLAVVGLKSGGGFFETLVHGPGLQWMGLGALITFVPLFVVGMVARFVTKMNYLSLSGILAGSMTDPPALAFAVSFSPVNAASVAYVTVYPLVMMLRILIPQILVLFLAATGAG